MIKLETGKKYKARNGKEVKIVATNTTRFPYEEVDGTSYQENGKFWGNDVESIYDLLEEVKGD